MILLRLSINIVRSHTYAEFDGDSDEAELSINIVRSHTWRTEKSGRLYGLLSINIVRSHTNQEHCPVGYGYR